MVTHNPFRRSTLLIRIALLASTAFLTACAATAPEAMPAPPVVAEAPAVAPAPVDQAAALKKFFEDYDKAELALSPISKAYRGIKDQDYGKLDPYTDAAAIVGRELDQRTADEMVARFNRTTLSADDQLSYDLLLYRNQRSASIFPYHRYAYVFDQMNGAQSDIPAFLINIHKVDTEQDARDYISRIRAAGTYIDQAVAEAQEREKLGVLPPKWVFPQVIEQSKNLISGAPFTTGADNDVFADFKAKVGNLNIPQETKTALMAEAHDALIESMGPTCPTSLCSERL